MSRIVRFKRLPAPFTVDIFGKRYELGGGYGYLGDRHPTLPGWQWVTWLGRGPHFNGYFERRQLLEIGTALIE